MRPLRLGGLLAATVLLVGSACGTESHERTLEVSASPVVVRHWRDVPEAPTTTITTTTAMRPAPKPVPPAVHSQATPAAQPVSAVDDAFWRRLANCESPSGADGGFNGYFQLAGSTAKAVGYHGGSYEEQLAAAKRWLGIIGVAKAGTRAGWPVCWWVALRG